MVEDTGVQTRRVCFTRNESIISCDFIVFASLKRECFFNEITRKFFHKPSSKSSLRFWFFLMKCRARSDEITYELYMFGNGWLGGLILS